MRKRHLEMALSRMDDLEEPDPGLEQYRTPPGIVADILWMALENGDIIEKSIIEPGCGGAPFALGALMMGASKATGIDIDERSIHLAVSNRNRLIGDGLLTKDDDAIFIVDDIASSALKIETADTVFMNPPFGAQKKHADRPFIDAACRLGRSLYCIHNGGTEDFVAKTYKNKGFEIADIRRTSMEIPHMFHFHEKERSSIEVLILNAVKV